MSVDVTATTCEKTEQLNYEFFDRTEDSVTIGLEWDTRQLPFTVKVDLNQTVVASFRDELRGINTYRWQAWNDAAYWCWRHDTNLEEALTWADRSINGGLNGFAANGNLENFLTKARILKKLGRDDEYRQTLNTALELNSSANEYNDFIYYLVGRRGL